nr:hypothetical protein Iba_chr06aCG13690 [Ipomoea batatas]
MELSKVGDKNSKYQVPRLANVPAVREARGKGRKTSSEEIVLSPFKQDKQFMEPSVDYSPLSINGDISCDYSSLSINDKTCERERESRKAIRYAKRALRTLVAGFRRWGKADSGRPLRKTADARQRRRSPRSAACSHHRRESTPPPPTRHQRPPPVTIAGSTTADRRRSTPQGGATTVVLQRREGGTKTQGISMYSNVVY